MAFSIRSYLSNDTIQKGDETILHVIVKNESSDTIIILKPKNKIAFLPQKGWNRKTGIYDVQIYNGPNKSTFLPGEEIDCGFHPFDSYFAEIPKGSSTLSFMLELFQEGKDKPYILSDSFQVFVK